MIILDPIDVGKLKSIDLPHEGQVLQVRDPRAMRILYVKWRDSHRWTSTYFVSDLPVGGIFRTATGVKGVRDVVRSFFH
jgi:hypothetical protein